ncbi:MAG: PQQ-binding-like beta-propeller repeat protein [Candidatus Eisenbacteria bacterium]|nr:PQQ-binding-like beta-propeller repeat protein [Candidatus Eisenbacteria bacterium]
MVCRATRLLCVILALLAVPRSGAAGGAGGIIWESRALIPGVRSVSSCIVDAGGDGRDDLLLTSSGREGPWWTLVVSGASGHVLWAKKHSSRPTVCPLHCSRGARVLVAESDRAQVLDCAGGDVLLAADLPAATGPATAGDLDGDGVIDVAIAVGDDRNDSLIGLSGSDLSVLFETAAAPGEGRTGVGFADPVALDSDGDGLCEIYVTENTDRLVRLEPTGARSWSVRLDERSGRIPRGAITGRPVLADVTGDDGPDLCVGCLAGKLAVLDPASGEVRVSRRFGRREGEDRRRLRRLPRFLRALAAGSGEPVNRLAAVEIDGRPGLELVFGCGDGSIHAYSAASDRELWSFQADHSVYEPPLALGPNTDGAPELVVWHYYSVLFLDGAGGEPIRRPPVFAGLELADPSGIMLADLDGDGDLEGVFVARGAERVFAWETGLPTGQGRRVR